MADYSGRKVAYGFSREATRGTQAASVQAWIPHLDADFGDKQEAVTNESALGVLDNMNDSALVKEWAEGKFDCKLQSNNAGWLLYAAFGSVSSAAGVAAGTYKHTFTRNNSNQGAALTIFKNTPNETLAYVLATLTSLEFEAVVGEYVKLSSSFIAKKGASQASTPAYSVEQEIEFTTKHLQLFVGNYGDSVATITAGAAIPLKSIKGTIDRMAETYHESGTNTPTEIHTKGNDVKFEVEKRFKDLVFKALAQSDTKKAIVIRLINTDQTIGTGGNPSIQFHLPKVSVIEHEVDEGLEDIAEESFTFQGLFDTTAGKQADCELVNTVANYTGV